MLGTMWKVQLPYAVQLCVSSRLELSHFDDEFESYSEEGYTIELYCIVLYCVLNRIDKDGKGI